MMTLPILQSLPEMTDLVKPLTLIEVLVFCSGDPRYLYYYYYIIIIIIVIIIIIPWATSLI